MSVAEERRSRAEDRLRYDTPFWAGGVYRDPSSGSWRKPGPDEFQGCAKILDKRKRLVPAIARPWQLELDEILEHQRARGMPMRVIILKARKLGFSTWIALKFLQRVTQLPYQAAVVVAQDVDTAGVILEMARLAYQNLPLSSEIGFPVKPGIAGEGGSKNGRQHLIFGDASRTARREGRSPTSIFEIDTAGSPTSGRGTTPNLLHLSEVAFWEAEQAMRKMLAMLEALPYAEETICAIESTANGLNHFYRRWINAKEGSQDPDSGEVYAPLFVPWWRDPDCSRKFATPEGRERFVREQLGNTTRYGETAEDEQMLVELYKCTPEQLLWRRMKIQEQPDKSVQTFNQENPHSEEVAFIGSGRTVIPGLLVTRSINNIKEKVPDPVLGTLRARDFIERRTRSGLKFVPREAAWYAAADALPDEHQLRVWEHPRHAEEAPERIDGREASDFERRQGAYVVAVDVAAGEEDTLSKGDFHAITVWDHHTRLQVAAHHSRMDIHEVPLWALLIALYYNEARLAVEVNGVGLSVVSPLQKDYRYRHMYRRRRIDTRSEERVDKAGWETSKDMKPAMEANFIGLLDSDLRGGLRDMPTARQMTTYVSDEKGRHGAQPGEYDDLLMSAMIGQMVMSMMPPPKIGGQRPKRFNPKDAVTGW